MNVFKHVYTANGSSEGQILAVTVLSVPNVEYLEDVGDGEVDVALARGVEDLGALNSRQGRT